MTDAEVPEDDPRVSRRADLSDAEQRAGSDDPVAQAEAILTESEERIIDGADAPGASVEHRHSEDTVDPIDPIDPNG